MKILEVKIDIALPAELRDEEYIDLKDARWERFLTDIMGEEWPWEDRAPFGCQTSMRVKKILCTCTCGAYFGESLRATQVHRFLTGHLLSIQEVVR